MPSTSLGTPSPPTQEKHAYVTWKLWAKANVGWRHDLDQELYLGIANNFSSPPVPLAFENKETQPKIRLSLSSNIYMPGETIEGKLTLLEPGNMREVRLQPSTYEYAEGTGPYNRSRSSDETIPVGNPTIYSRDTFIASQEIPFRIPLAPQLPHSYKGTYSSVGWCLYATVDIPQGQDIHIGLPFNIGLKTPQPVTAQPAGSVSDEPEMVI